MDSRNEIASAVREAKKNLGEAADFRVADALAILEGMAPFLDREVVVNIKCKSCDNYARASFPLSHDFYAVDEGEHCHARQASIKNLTVSKLAGCSDFSRQASEDLMELGKAILEEDLAPAFKERKLYDRRKFASYKVAFRLIPLPGMVCIQLGHEVESGFTCSDIKIYILRRIDPGFGAEASQKISQAMKGGPVMVVQSSLQTRRQLDIDYLLEWIAERRKMDIVYL
ncbi:MAG TPA: hypothetical protein PLQ38_00820 [Methanothrix sp.]|nr:hypothetical protein [Methanothrix sp.]